jgi:trans-2,3-dihydro-3-hydroxyanthranilate isomerase
VSLSYEVVDVFTDTPFAGNPLAVVLDGEDLTTSQMLALAREFNLSETAFPLPAPEGATYGLRIFTPMTELPFAGHPSVGSAAVLHRLGRIESGANVQACGAGLLPVHVGEQVTLTGGQPTYGDPVDPAPLLAALGLDATDLAGTPPRWAGAGLEFAFLLVRPEALATARADVAAVSAVGSGISLVSWDGTNARVRMFPGGVGIAEDPATGSAALGLGVFLAAAGLVGEGTTGYVVTQGVEMGRRSTLTCEVEVVDGAAVRTSVSGTTVPVATGTIRVPSA